MRLIRYPYVYTQKYSWMQSWRNDNIYIIHCVCVSAAHAKCTWYMCMHTFSCETSSKDVHIHANLYHFWNCVVQSNSFFSLRPGLGITFHGSSQLGSGSKIWLKACTWIWRTSAATCRGDAVHKNRANLKASKWIEASQSNPRPLHAVSWHSQLITWQAGCKAVGWHS